jgi:hypothetical protein
MPDLWDTNPDHVFSTPDEQPNPTPNDHDDHPKQVRLRDDRGRLRPPTYVLIALAIAVVAVLLAIAVLLLGARDTPRPGRAYNPGMTLARSKPVIDRIW